MAGRVFKIGTRGSDLALWQARHVASVLAAPSETTIITTSGDRFLDASPTGRLEKGFFTKEIEDALLESRIDIAVHSLKDLPTALVDGLAVGAVSAREAVSDWLLVRAEAVDLSCRLPVKPGSRVGASSLRRQSMLRAFGDGLEPVMLRGNVPTRVQKCRRGEYDAVIVAAAGLKRLQLDLTGLAVFELVPEIWLPAPGQAALGVEIRAADGEARQALAPIENAESRACVEIERSLLHRFEGGCHEAFGAWVISENGGLVVRLGHENARDTWVAVALRGMAGEAIVGEAFTVLSEAMQSNTAAAPEGPVWRFVSS
ncbi:MAG: hydroxymethylbilane synthase [Acidobacteria bacterium]|nr:hydroxymethylbilane synthase [Acidobacteriota bacterium]